MAINLVKNIRALLLSATLCVPSALPSEAALPNVAPILLNADVGTVAVPVRRGGGGRGGGGRSMGRGGGGHHRVRHHGGHRARGHHGGRAGHSTRARGHNGNRANHGTVNRNRNGNRNV